MESAWKETNASLNIPSFHAGTPQAPTKAGPNSKGKAKAKEPDVTEEEDEEEIATHLGGGDP